jgi:hypothetical protein
VRLAKQVVRLELKADEKARSKKGCAFGIVWSADDQRLPAGRRLKTGELVALDVTITGFSGGVACIRSVERVTRDAEDLGVVYAADGMEVVGRIVELTPQGFVWCLREDYAAQEHNWQPPDTSTAG